MRNPSDIIKSHDTGRQDGQSAKFCPANCNLVACVSGEHFGVTGGFNIVYSTL